MAYNATTIAKYIVQTSHEDGYPVSNLQLQKILYYTQREFLQKEDKPLFFDEIEAWQFGPVVPVVYHKYCGSAALPLTFYDRSDFLEIDSYSKMIINRVVKEKEKINPWDMVKDLHQPGKAWDLVFQGGRGNYDVIPKLLIKEKG